MRSPAGKVERLRNKVLETALQHVDDLRDHPQHLAWVMMHYQMMHRLSRVRGEHSDNPKVPIIAAGDTRLTEADANLLYDAWGVTVSNEDEFPDTNPNCPIEAKPNKTLDEWVAVKTHPLFRYRSLYPHAQAVKVSLLCVIGTGKGWNADGFVTDLGPCGTDEVLFAGYTRAEEEIREDIRSKILRVRENPLVKDEAGEYLRKVRGFAQRIYAGEDDLEVFHPEKRKERKERERKLKAMGEYFAAREGDLTPDESAILSGLTYFNKKVNTPTPESQWPLYPLSSYSNLVTMPAHAHPSYVQAGKELAAAYLADSTTGAESQKFAKLFLQRWQ